MNNETDPKTSTSLPFDNLNHLTKIHKSSDSKDSIEDKRHWDNINKQLDIKYNKEVSHHGDERENFTPVNDIVLNEGEIPNELNDLINNNVITSKPN